MTCPFLQDYNAVIYHKKPKVQEAILHKHLQ